MDSTKVALAFVAGAVVAGVGAYLFFVGAADAGRVPCGKNDDSTATSVTIKVSASGNTLVADPPACTVVPGQYIIWQFPDIADLRLRFGTDYLGPTPADKTPDENFGVLFASSASLQKNRDLSIRTGKIDGATGCVKFPYFLSPNGTNWDANPAIIIKPGAATVCN